MKIYYLSDVEKKRLAEKQKAGAFLTSYERGYLKQLESNAQQEGKRQAGLAQAQNDKAIADATPAHLKRPRNLAQEAIDHYTAGDKFKTPETVRRLEQLKIQAAAREAEIVKEMDSKRIAYETANDPDVQRALQHCDFLAEKATAEDKPAWAAARGLLTGGGKLVVDKYYQQAQAILETTRQRNSAAATEAGAALDAAYKKYAESQAGVDQCYAAAEITLQESRRLLGD